MGAGGDDKTSLTESQREARGNLKWAKGYYFIMSGAH